MNSLTFRVILRSLVVPVYNTWDCGANKHLLSRVFMLHLISSCYASKLMN